MTLKKKKSYFEEELAKNTNKPKQPWDFKVTRSKFRQSKQIKHLSWENGTSQFEALKTQLFQKVLLLISWRPPKNLPKAPNQFTNLTTKNYYVKTLL